MLIKEPFPVKINVNVGLSNKNMSYKIMTLWIVVACLALVLLYYHVSPEYFVGQAVSKGTKAVSGIVGDAADYTSIATKVSTRLDEAKIPSAIATDAFKKGGDDLVDSLSKMKSSLQKQLDSTQASSQRKALEKLISDVDRIKTLKGADGKTYFLDMTDINKLGDSGLPVDVQNKFKVKAFEDMAAVKSMDDAVVDWTRALNPELAGTSKVFVPRKALIDSMDEIMKLSGKNLDDMSPAFVAEYRSLQKASWTKRIFSTTSLVTGATFAVAIASVLIGIFVKPSYMNSEDTAGGDRDPYSNECSPGDINCMAMDWLDWMGDNSTMLGLSSCMSCCCCLMMCCLMMVMMLGGDDEANYY
jgi:hypothetical protein